MIICIVKVHIPSSSPSFQLELVRYKIYRIAESCWGRKLSRISWFGSHLWKFSPQNATPIYNPVCMWHSANVFSAKYSLPTHPQKFSPLKIYSTTADCMQYFYLSYHPWILPSLRVGVLISRLMQMEVTMPRNLHPFLKGHMRDSWS